MSDAYFSSVQLLLRANGSDGSTTFTDESNAARSMTARGNAQLDTAQKKYGSASMQFDGTGDAVTCSSVTGLTLTGDFTIELWARPANTTFAFLIALNSGWWIDTTGLFNDADAQEILFGDGSALGSGTWKHIAWVRSGSTHTLYLDGVSQGTFTKSGTITPSAGFFGIGGGWNGSAVNDSLNGWIDDLRITVGVARYTSGFTPPGEHELGAPPDHEVHISAPSPLSGSERVLVSTGRFNVRISAPSPLGAGAVLGFADWTGLTTGREITPFLLDLITPGGTVRVPMSSWQATLQVENQCFASAVIPACAEWIDTLDEATEFRILRSVTLTNGTTIENPLVTCPLDTLQIDEGPTNYTASISGYFDAFAEVEDPREEFDRTLQGVRSISTYASGVRLRCALDYLLLPGMRAHYGDASSLVVAYLNTYVTQSGRSPQAYMDVGSRAV